MLDLFSTPSISESVGFITAIIGLVPAFLRAFALLVRK